MLSISQKGCLDPLLFAHNPVKTLVACFYFLFAVTLAFRCYRHSSFDIDLLGLAGNVALGDTSDPVSAHRIVYKEHLTPHLRGTDSDDPQARILRKRASDAYYSTLYLPYFSIKPLYISVLQLVHKLGANVVDATRIVSAACFFGIAVAVWLYTRSALAAVVLILPEALTLGQANEADGMSVMLLLFGLWAVFLKESNWGVLAVIASVWVRPDNSLLCYAVLVTLYVLGRLKFYECAVLLGLTFGSNILISHFGEGWRALYFHTFLGGEPGQAPRFTAADYLRALARGTTEAMHSSAPAYAILWTICLFGTRDAKLRLVLALVAAASLARFLIFPNYEPRYYGLFFIVTLAAAVLYIRDAHWSSQNPALNPQ